MAMPPRLRITLSFLLLAVGSLVNLAADPVMTFIPANDPRFRLEGRFDRAKPTHPVVIWSGSRLSLDFEGGTLAVVFGAGTGQTFFNVTVDDRTEIVSGSDRRWSWPHPLGPGRHRLEIFKRSEADAGQVEFGGVELAQGAQAWAPAPPAYRFKMEFLGDSITVGANNEDGAVDQWEDRRTHNHALSYGYLTAQVLGADHRAMAVSGMGLCEGYVPMKAGEVWDKIYPRADAPRADLAAWQPDVVCINLGENDDSFPRNNQRPFPAGFTAAYVALVRAVRAAYPEAQIVLLRGGMFGGAKSVELRAGWAGAVLALEAGDPRISHYVFKHWSEQHPRVSDHRAMATELTAWLRQQPFMASYLENTK